MSFSIICSYILNKNELVTNRLINLHNTVKGSCCDVFCCGELVFKVKNICT